ncbi:MAG TPA: hypothetical protein PLD70_12115 [Thermotogota bacterium]|nr:hypothetical protein [Thermotogota bacterium]
MNKRKVEKLEEAIEGRRTSGELGNYRMVINASAEPGEPDTHYETRNGERVVDPKLITRLESAYRKAFSKGEVNVSVSFEDYNEIGKTRLAGDKNIAETIDR